MTNSSANSSERPLRFEVSSPDAGKRLDRYLPERLPSYSRSRLQGWIASERVKVGGAPQKPSYLVREGDVVEVWPAQLPPLAAVPESIPLTVLYEDADVVAIDKPAGMVVHAGAGVHSGTLVNALLARFGALSAVGGELRPGIVHRLDRFTSGVLLVAKNDEAHRNLASQFSGRKVEKIYWALVHGTTGGQGKIEKPIARDPVHRIRMTARLSKGRTAVTSFRAIRRFEKHTLLEVRIATGRTHQIRVHLSSIGHPVVGDPLYGAAREPDLNRYFLHARSLRFAQPSTGALVQVESPLPLELAQWLETLKPGL